MSADLLPTTLATIGSIGFIGIVRSGLMVGEHPELDDTFVLAGQKHNLSKPPASFAYRIRSAGSGDDTAIIEYRGISEVTAQQMSSTPEDEGERSRLAEAKEFLRDLLRAGPEFTGRIKAEAKEAEIGWRTVERAKAELKLQSVKDPESSKWQWTLSGPTEEGDEARASSPRRSEHGGDGGDGGLRGSSERPPNMADMAGFDSTTTTTTYNEAYIREDRQDRLWSSNDQRDDEDSTLPSDSANGGRHDFHRDPTAYKETF